MSEKALVIIPTFNEAENIAQIVPLTLAQGENVSVLVVDDGSPDGTGKIADDLAGKNERVHVIHREGKQGLGTAYITGFKWALKRDYEIVFEMDADFSHDPAHIRQFLETVEDCDLVLGSRYLDGKVTVINWPIRRLMLSYSANLYARFVTGHRVCDATGGFKCFRRKVLEAIKLDRVRSNGYAFQIEMSYRAFRRGFKIKEIPIVFTDRTDGESKMSRKIIREAIWMVWRLRLQSMFGRL